MDNREVIETLKRLKEVISLDLDFGYQAVLDYVIDLLSKDIIEESGEAGAEYEVEEVEEEVVPVCLDDDWIQLWNLNRGGKIIG